MAIGAERILTERELNRAVLARQLLLERARTPIPRALERIAGIQAQYAPSMYVGLWSRLAGFERGQLTRALERRAVVQGTLMRATIHLVSRGDYWPLVLAIRDARRAWWVRAHRGRLAESDATAAAATVRRRLAAGHTARRQLAEGLDTMLFNSAHVWLDIVRIPPSGTWERRRADVYALAEEWIGPPGATAEQGLAHLVRRYLQGFGPAAPAEIADWAGLPVRQVNDLLETLDLRRFRDERGGVLVDLPRLPLPSPDAPAPPRFLPTWTQPSSPTAAARRSSPSCTARGSSARRRRSRPRRSPSTGRSRARGSGTGRRSSLLPSGSSGGRRASSSTPRRSRSPSSIGSARAVGADRHASHLPHSRRTMARCATTAFAVPASQSCLASRRASAPRPLRRRSQRGLPRDQDRDARAPSLAAGSGAAGDASRALPHRRVVLDSSLRGQTGAHRGKGAREPVTGITALLALVGQARVAGAAHPVPRSSARRGTRAHGDATPPCRPLQGRRARATTRRGSPPIRRLRAGRRRRSGKARPPGLRYSGGCSFATARSRSRPPTCRGSSPART